MNKKKAAVHLHHIGSHFTNALFPVAAVLITLYLFTGHPSFEPAAFYCVVFGALAAPLTYLTGVYDWRTRFSGRRTSIFDQKIAFGLLFLTLSLTLIAVRAIWPDIATADGTGRWVYVGLIYAATACATWLGHLGSKFI